jgi:protein-S-isoprenylcysteine O-methyltransferase Ste14
MCALLRRYTTCTGHSRLDAHSPNGPTRRRRASDWAGFFGHLAVAVFTVVRTPTLTLFLLPGIVHMLVAAGSFLVRDIPRRKEQDPFGRIVSYAGGFGVFGFVQFAASFRPDWIALTGNAVLGLAGFALGFMGVLFEIWAVWHLRFAFATEPAARRLVMTGPYRFARHPIYTGGSVAYLGLIMTHPTVPLAITLAGWAVSIGLRMRYEEAILTQAFPEYVEYRRRVGALLPRPAVLSARDTAPASS